MAPKWITLNGSRYPLEEGSGDQEPTTMKTATNPKKHGSTAASLQSRKTIATTHRRVFVTRTGRKYHTTSSCIGLFNAEGQWEGSTHGKSPCALCCSGGVRTEAWLSRDRLARDRANMAIKHFRNGNYKASSQAYTQALSGIGPIEDKVMVLSNRAECYLRMGQNQSALSDIESALKLDPNHEKSLCRLKRCEKEATPSRGNEMDREWTYEELLKFQKMSEIFYDPTGEHILAAYD
jgi:tetratricopeptide (TPR) repeat protein